MMNYSQGLTLVGILILALTSNCFSSPVDSKIVGGDLAVLKQFPYQAALLRSNLQRAVVCGGSILSPRYILTAAHCILGANPTDFVVRVGQVHLQNNLTELYEQEVRVSKLIVHPDYSYTRFLNDIALIELVQDLILDGDFVASISLPLELQQEVSPGSDCVVTGWGATKEGGPASKDLEYTHLPSMSDDSCRVRYPNYIHASMLCTGFAAGGVDVCFGDSGGGVSCDDGKTVNGIVSWGDGGCARPDTPSVHTQVSYFIDWIQAQMS